MLNTIRLLLAAGILFVMACPGTSLGAADLAADAGPIPRLLRDTGLYAGGAGNHVRDSVVPFSPQYPLWSDGADKRRWMYLPPGTAIDAARPDAWVFPRGTKLWKEFAHDGRPVETRYIERGRDGAWRFAAYVWNEAGTEAVLAPARGVVLAVPGAPQGRYAVPGRADCLACHGSAPVPVLGASALQLSPDRDPQAVHGRPPRPGEANLGDLVARGWVRGLPRELLAQPPRIAASAPLERAALGYLHGNCAHCHNTGDTRVPLRLTLAQRAGDAAAARAEVLATTFDAESRYRPADSGGPSWVVSPGNAAGSLLAARMHSRNAQVQMPPLGTHLADAEGLALIQRWIDGADSTHRKETSP